MSTVQATFQPCAEHPARGRLLLYSADGTAPEEQALARLGLPLGDPGTARLARPRGGELTLTDIPVRSAGLSEALPALLGVALDRYGRWQQGPSDALRAWALVARLALRVVAAQRVIPLLVPADGAVNGVWHAAVAHEPTWSGALAALAASMPPAAHALAFDGEVGVWQPRPLVEAFVHAVADHAVRASGAYEASGRPRDRVLPWTARWSEALADPDDPAVPLGQDTAELLAGVTGWSTVSPDAGAAALELRLEAPPEDEDPWVLRLGVRNMEGQPLSATQIWQDHVTELADDLLVGLALAARAFEPLERVLGEATPTAAELTLEEVWHLLSEAAPLLAEAGIVLHIPPSLDAEHLRLRLRVAGKGEADPLTEDLTYDWELALGDEALEPSDAAALADAAARASVPLLRWGRGWVRIEPAHQPLLATSLGVGGRLPAGQGLALALAGETPVAEVAGAAPDVAQSLVVDVVAAGALRELVEQVRGASAPVPVPVSPPGFHGELRPYQRRGVAWLRGMRQLGLGAVLADAMGLGKTIQLIGHLLAEQPEGRHLVVCPTSVVGNWQRELSRFAPDLPVHRWHGPERPDSAEGLAGVVVTSYGTLRRDVDVLARSSWAVVALDEAQQVKNPATASARAVRALDRAQTVALTGTPLENRLSDLWSLLDVTNPGLLGGPAAFERRYAVPIERHRDPGATRRLRRLVAPFVLRREKSDPQVAADLPSKIERTVACGLTTEQAKLYERAVADVLGDGLPGEQAQRRMQVLALLTRLKQICNHPAHFLKEPPGGTRLHGRSGKLAATEEILAEAAAGGEQALLFTQYVTMGHLLVEHLEAELGLPVPFLHGGLAAGRRDRLVAGFHGDHDALQHLGWEDPPPVFIVSLRAGGTGLNLTAATQVIHYDRWWNPAVEDQATDRTHRIGQLRSVEVHKLVTAGTVEERIAEVLERKRDLAADVVGAGESWIAELDDEDLRALVQLSAEPAVDDFEDAP